MKRRGFIVLVLVLAISTLACSVGGWNTVSGSGHVTEEEYEVSGVTAVTLTTIGNLYISVGDEEELRIEAEDNLLQYFEVEVDSGVLEIGAESGVNLQPTALVNFYLTVSELDTIVLAGSGDIEAPDLEAEQFSVTISGSGDVYMGALDADAIEVLISGSGDLHVSGGVVTEQIITISGSGKYEARDLASATAEVSITGSGSITIRVRDSLKVSISGSGSVRYAGNPTLDRVTVSGSGSIEQIGD